METANIKSSKFTSVFAAFVIPTTLVASFILYFFVLGNPANFVDGDTSKHPQEGNYLGIVYKGGIIVPVLMSFLLMVLTFSLERFLTIRKAFGTSSLDKFLFEVKADIASSRFDTAIDKSVKQKGSVGNIVFTVLKTCKKLIATKRMNKEQKLLSLQKELEEATSLELPMLEKNLTIIATLASIATLTGLLGTVIGMIKAFAALATQGSPDASALANGISEALINTALGIATSAFAIVSYNYFTSKIDMLTYSIDEIGFSMQQNFSVLNQEEEEKEKEVTLVPTELV